MIGQFAAKTGKVGGSFEALLSTLTPRNPID
jgi:hypothetical protein